MTTYDRWLDNYGAPGSWPSEDGPDQLAESQTYIEREPKDSQHDDYEPQMRDTNARIRKRLAQRPERLKAGHQNPIT